ncbi:hypothetical protein [Falsiroseomonas sp.]|uniref:hypothetical protein n=1 Tax=Falsiroseomonas sp. TaxID=2870721 RepID=UPI003566B3F9
MLTETIADIVERTIGTELSPRNLQVYATLDKDQLIKLRRALDDSLGPEFEIPQGRPGVTYHLLDPNSPMNAQLGGAGSGFGFRVSASLEELVARLNLVLMYSPRIVIRDGLEYHLDGYPSYRPQKSEEDVRRILSFYCIIRRLIADGTVVVVPRKFWFDAEYALRRGPRYWLKPDLIDPSSDIERIIKKWFEFDYARSKDTEALELGAQIDLANNLLYLRRLFYMASEYRYDPVIERPVQQVLFEIMRSQLTFNPNLRATSPYLADGKATLPLLGSVRPSEVLAARDTPSFALFRRTIEQIDLAADDMDDRPIELQQLMRDKLADAKAAIDRDFRTSSFLSNAWTEARDIGLSVVGGSWFAAQMSQAWADDPLKLFATGAAAAAVKLGMTAASDLRKRAAARHTARLVLKLQEAAR